MTLYQTTNTILKNKKITFEIKDDDYRFVKSTQRIKQGELILIEHCPSVDDINIIPNIILNSPELFDNLYQEKYLGMKVLYKNQTMKLQNYVMKRQKKIYLV